MNQDIIKQVKSKLKSMYPEYRFEIKCSADGNNYMINAFKNKVSLGILLTPSTTPMDLFWDRIKSWMRGFFKK